ncbi:hypothetical protein [Lysobacter sp. CA199]|uniref:hypothetical protein n=1 Tax=Lysobacter sp. CA199 TaxID=3455608 RepID=UPI003F8D0CA5
MLFALAVSACGAATPRPAATGADAATVTDPFAALRPLCGKAYAGRVVVDTPKSAEDPFAGKTLVMHVRDCRADEIRIPFHVGDDRSRTWVFTAHDGALRLKHDHRHRDGSSDALTMYGGDQRGLAQAGRYEFPADAYSQAMFRKLGREVSVPNVWAIEIVPLQAAPDRFVYELARPGRLFRVEFDLTRPIPAPPPPWGG